MSLHNNFKPAPNVKIDSNSITIELTSKQIEELTKNQNVTIRIEKKNDKEN